MEGGGDAEAPEEVWQRFSPELAQVEFATNQIRLTIDEPAITGWNEIDAVGLVGMPQ